MWTRSLLKQNAKDALRGRYWRSFLLCFLLTLLGIGDYSPQYRVTYDLASDELDNLRYGPVWEGNASVQDLWAELNDSNLLFLLQFGVVLLLIGVVIGLCWAFFLVNPLTVGRNRYFMESRQAPAPMKTVLTIFRPPYMNVVKVSALVSLKIALGSLLIIPGIYWQYCYWMVPYLLAENPYLTTGRAMELSRQMMEGEKLRTFVLVLSFIGWIFLSVLTLGIGLLFLEPYYQATMAELYAVLRSKAFSLNLTDENELCGFVRHDADA